MFSSRTFNAAEWNYDVKNKVVISRILFDECHQFLTSHSFRPGLIRLAKLARYEVSKGYLTGTLPPRLEKAFIKEMNLHNLGQLPIVRVRSDKPNLGYHLAKFDGKQLKMLHLVQKVVHYLHANWLGKRGQLLIIFPSIALVEEFASAMPGCSKSYRGLKEDEIAVNETE
jgi:superfamily II DNA helicase RecQ